MLTAEQIEPPPFLEPARTLAEHGQIRAAVEQLRWSARRALELGQPHRALATYTHILALDPSEIIVHVDIAQVEAKTGQYRAAIFRLENLANAFIERRLFDDARIVLSLCRRLMTLADRRARSRGSRQPQWLPMGVNHEQLKQRVAAARARRAKSLAYDPVPEPFDEEDKTPVFRAPPGLASRLRVVGARSPSLPLHERYAPAAPQVV